MITPIVRHWRRGDDDRLFITTTTGRQLGWFDLNVETLHTATESFRPMLWRAVTDFRLGRRPEIPAAADLASHQAGVWELERAFRCVDESPVFFSASAMCGERDERGDWQRASETAQTVAEAVAGVPGGWAALHSVPSGRHGERLDHVLVGPAGVVVVMSEHVTDGEVIVGGDTVVFDGVGQKVLGHLSKLADHVTTRVPAGEPVHVVVVVHGATVTRRRALGDPRVQVVGIDDLAAVIATLSTPVDGPAQDAVFASLRQLRTWCPTAKATNRSTEASFAVAGLQLLDGLPVLGDKLPRSAAKTRRPRKARPSAAA